ncbi:hypothetical protein [Actinophytocola xanthii]|uniref:hypothetical protein n=1 Tax=Actinophytocola xanthii TaxID=1912961 RepID=UPI0009FA9A9F|nr:hypothetical protein [Actinophytocola xanthii]
MFYFGLDNPVLGIAFAEGGRFTSRLPKGTYLMDHAIVGEDGESPQFDWLVQPGLVVDQDVTLTIDARTAEPVSVTPPAAAENLGVGLGYALSGPDGPVLGAGVGLPAISGARTAQVGALAAGYTIDGTVDTEWLGAAGEYYHLAWYPREFPVGFTKVVTRAELATVRVDVGKRVDAGGPIRFASYPAPTTNASPSAGANGIDITAPTVRTLYLTTADTVWSYGMWLSEPDGSDNSRYSSPADKSYTAGRTYREPFNHAVFGPALPAEPNPYSLGRLQDQMALHVHLYSDHAGNLGDNRPQSEWTRLYAGDQLIDESPFGGIAMFSGLPAEPVDYRITTESVRKPAFTLSSSVSAEWTFRSSFVEGPEPESLPVNVLRFQPKLDQDNAAPAGTRFHVPILMQSHTGGTVVPRTLTVEASYDEGKSWRTVPVLGKRTAVLTHPADAKTVSFRASASDAEGNTVKQTIVRAYHLR